MAKHTVPHVWCGSCQKRAFEDEHLADKALGRAVSHRNRLADKQGASRRGQHRENRFYECPAGFFHLTSMSRRKVRL
ncbi:hypothetical protein [Actinoplanes sp. NPDC026670]|uniref:hypothetical protein n=1 Tax=Actinoplanes sp. NPDC026670 TaxID=3154700 RepID=UPI0033D52012